MKRRIRKRMRKWWPFGLALLLLLGAALWAGFVFSRGPTFRYSNLVDEAAQMQARSLLTQGRIPTEDMDDFFELVRDFYSVPYKGVVESGWKKVSTRSFSYGEKAAFDHFNQTNNAVTCRTAAFLLMRDRLMFGSDDLPPAEEKDQTQAYLPEPEDRMHYNLLFAALPSGTAETSEEVWDALAAYWEKADIGFRSGTAQLVTVYGMTGDTIQNFHAAVALYGEDGVWLLEKYDPLYPFQFSHFEQEQDMVTYLQRRAAEVDCAVITRGGECLWQK